MKFSIRDLLWLTVVIALGVAWCLDHRRQGAENAKINKYLEFYERDLMTTRSSGFAVPPGRVIPGTTVTTGD
ncbi:MAG: hypothetical protein ACR2FY_12635 [Pirellulaceae bacterium]